MIRKLCCISVLLGACASEPEEKFQVRSQAPNFLLIYTDDQPVGTLTEQFMPFTFREIVKKGINFTRSYASVPVCCPDRAGTYSGMWGHNTGTVFNSDTGVVGDAPGIDLPNGGITSFDWDTAIPKILQDTGYETALFGKVMNEHEALCTDVVPPATCTTPAGWDRFVSFTQDGFNFMGEESDWYVGSPTGGGTASDYYYTDDGVLKSAYQLRRETPARGPFDCSQEKICHNLNQSDCETDFQCLWDGSSCRVATCIELDSNDYSTDLVRDLFIEWLDRVDLDQPWFAVLGFYAPHFDRGFYNLPPAARHDGVFEGVPVPNPPSFNEADVSDKPAWVQNAQASIMTSPAGVIANRTNYWQRVRESLLGVDEAVTEVVKRLDFRGQGSNTLIIYLSDNGYLMGEHRLGMKNLPYEESSKVPMALRWLDKRPAGFVEPDEPRLVSNVDIAPTLAEAAGATGCPDFNGRSLMPLIELTPVVWRTDILSEGWFPDSAPGPFTPALTPFHPDWKAVWRDDGWKYVDYDTGLDELYDLTNDPFELVNEVNNPAHAAILTDLQARLSILRSE